MKIKKTSKLNTSGLSAVTALSILLPPKAVTAAKDCESIGDSEQLEKCVNANPIIGDIQMIIAFLSAGVGIIVVGVIIVGGIQYMTAGIDKQGSPSAVAAAKQRIINGLIALVAFLLIFAFIQWLIPGGVF